MKKAGQSSRTTTMPSSNLGNTYCNPSRRKNQIWPSRARFPEDCGLKCSTATVLRVRCAAKPLVKSILIQAGKFVCTSGTSLTRAWAEKTNCPISVRSALRVTKAPRILRPRSPRVSGSSLKFVALDKTNSALFLNGCKRSSEQRNRWIRFRPLSEARTCARSRPEARRQKWLSGGLHAD